MTRKHRATQRPWTPDECSIASELWQRHIVDVYGDNEVYCDGAKIRTQQLIARRLDRTVVMIQGRFHNYGPTFEGKTGHQKKQATERALAERDARLAAAEQRTYTQAFCGDPPVGFSALDRRR